MPTTEPTQGLRIHRLSPDRESRHARSTEAREVTDLVGSRIGLERDLGIGRETEPLSD